MVFDEGRGLSTYKQQYDPTSIINELRNQVDRWRVLKNSYDWRVTPGLTIKDRLRVLQPNDPDSYYRNRELVPQDMLTEIEWAKIIITNYHGFRLRERFEISKGGRSLLSGRTGEGPRTGESEGQMLHRVMPELLGLRNIMVMNDEAHHCYREKPDHEGEKFVGDDRIEAEKNNEEARLWINGLEAVNRKIGISRVVDLSATPFFLRGREADQGGTRSL